MRRTSILPLSALHLAGNALLLALGYYWLGVGESDTGHLFWSAFIILSAFACALWLHGTALVWFGRNDPVTLSGSMQTAARHIVPLGAVAMCAIVSYVLLQWLSSHFEHQAFIIGSYATMKLRKPVAPQRVLHWYQIVIWICRWLIAPAILFPLAGAVARFGWSGFRFSNVFRHRSIFFWIEVPLLLLAAIAAPLHLLYWVPNFPAFGMQMTSFVLRVGIGYLLFVGALLTLEFLTSRGRPVLNQPNTVLSP